MVFGSREMVSGHRSMVLPGSDMPSALGLVFYHSTLSFRDLMNYFFRLCMQEADMIGVCIIRVLSKLRK